MRRAANVGLVVLSLVATTAAGAHGPCIRNVRMQPCLVPGSGPPGTRVAIVGIVAYGVVWNDPAAADIAGHDYYRSRSRTIVVAKRSPYPEQRVRFRVPRVAPGRYAVIIHDGAEGGTHYTWSFFRVTRSG